MSEDKDKPKSVEFAGRKFVTPDYDRTTRELAAWFFSPLNESAALYGDESKRPRFEKQKARSA